MKASELIRRAAELIEYRSSPYQTELVTQLQHLHYAAIMHERVVSARHNVITVPRENVRLATDSNFTYGAACSIEGGG